MKLTELDAQVIERHGELLVIPHSGWPEILSSREMAGLPVSEWVEPLSRFCAEHSSHFKLALMRDGSGWIPLPMLEISGGWARVQVERVTCEACCWYGAIANPTEPTLYFGPSRFEALRAAWSLPRENCPRCGGALPRFAAWTEPASGETAQVSSFHP